MSTHGITRSMTRGPSRLKGGLVGAYYLLTIATGTFILFFHGRISFIANLLVAISYLAITAFLYGWSASENRRDSAARPRS
jgi:VIT1/CCC1 family predicted Fe2+/Mn2+ transporter